MCPRPWCTHPSVPCLATFMSPPRTPASLDCRYASCRCCYSRLARGPFCRYHCLLEPTVDPLWEVCMSPPPLHKPLREQKGGKEGTFVVCFFCTELNSVCVRLISHDGRSQVARSPLDLAHKFVLPHNLLLSSVQALDAEVALTRIIHEAEHCRAFRQLRQLLGTRWHTHNQRHRATAKTRDEGRWVSQCRVPDHVGSDHGDVPASVAPDEIPCNTTQHTRSNRRA